jgi:hypothetical protein
MDSDSGSVCATGRVIVATRVAKPRKSSLISKLKYFAVELIPVFTNLTSDLIIKPTTSPPIEMTVKKFVTLPH